jgi:NADH:ubiquinone oxidoreductase subunit E
MMEHTAYDLVVTDLKMPDIDGITFIRWIKRKWPNTGIVIITGYPSQDTIKEALNLGIIDYVPKPFTPSVLLDVATRALEFIGKTKKTTKPEDYMPPSMLEELDRVIDEYRNKPGGLVPVLERAQEIVGYLPPRVQKRISRGLKIPPAEVHSIVSFYNFFTMKPRGEHTVRVCLGTACFVKKAEEIMLKVQQELGINIDEVTPDLKFSLEAVRCLGVCGLAPVVVVDQDTYGMMDTAKVKPLLTMYQEMKA